MRYSFIACVLIVALASCKKPKHGYWEATFTDNDPKGTITQRKMRLTRRPDKFLFDASSDPFAQGRNVNGQLQFNRKGITYGVVYIIKYSSLNYGQENIDSLWVYSDFRGTPERKSLSGTYSFTKTVVHTDASGSDTTDFYAGNGAFELKWLEKIPREEK
jgi:hypothetical protein